MGRTSADITIHRIDGTTFNVPITTEARRTFGLGREDNIRLKWDGTTPYRARVGDWVNDDLFGLFYVTEEQEPTVDSATGAYRHDIRFDRDYIGWKNVLHMLTYSDGGSIVRKETDWSLTDTLANHLKAVKDGLSALGYTMATSVVESGVDNSDSAVTISFAGTSVYDALNTIADAYRCEWWVTYNSDYSVRTIHMGKMELSGSAYPITLGDNAEDITPNKSDAETANRVYAFGSTRNIPDTYRKTLSFSVTDTATRTSDSRSATVFRDSSRVVRQDMLRLSQSLDFDLRLSTPAYETNAGGQRYKAVFTDAMTIDRMVRYAATGNLEYTVEFVRDDASESTELEGYAWELRIGSDIIGSGAAMFSNHERVLGRAVKTVSVPVDESLVLQPGSTEARFSVWTNDGILVLSTASANSGVLSLKAEGYGIDCPLTFNGNTYTVTFNPLAEEITTSVFNWFAFSGQVPSGFAVGSKYTLGVSEDESDPGLLPLKIPVSFYTDDMGSLSVMKMIGERRLMLPTSTPGYVERGDTSVNRVVEKVVVFDNEYPKLCLQITEIEEGAYTDNTEWSDGSRSYGTLPKYTIKVKRVASGGSLADFPFKSDYLTTEPLKAVFMTRDEAVGHGAVPPSTAGFKLSGMTFGLNFSAAAQTYTIAFNEDYGAKLPNGILRPQVGDCLLLTGWNVAALTSLGLVSASEDRLLSFANDYIDALQAPSHTYRCRMMSDSMMEDGLLEAGRKVVITRDDISDSTRVIGFEYKLDIPEDTPVYECGETETYSRLRALEKALNARSQSVSSSSGTLTSSYSQSGSESQPSQPASLTGKLYWKGGAVTDFEGDDFDGSEDKTLTVPTDISHLSGSGTLPRIGKVKETLEDGTKVIDLLDDSGTKLLPSANIDWFIVEELTENEVITYRLKLNPKYEGMYAESWVSAGGVSDQGGGITGYLKDLLDVNGSMIPVDGQALVWDSSLGDNGRWTSKNVSVDLTPFERTTNKVTSISASSTDGQYPSARAVYNAMGSYLPLTGGTMTGDILQKMTVDTSNYRAAFQWVNTSGVRIAEIGYMNTAQSVFINPQGSTDAWSDAAGKYSLKIRPDNNGLTFNTNKVWHAGNDGSGSGLDADLLDGWQGKHYVLYDESTLGNNVDFNTITYERTSSVIIQPVHVLDYSGQANYPVQGYGQMLTFGGHDTFSPFRIAHSSTTRSLYYQSAGYRTPATFDFSEGSAWREIAFVDSNVASATKLETARKLWGNDFDGTSDVKGSLEIFSTGGSYNEGIRIHPASNGWSGVVFASSDNTGSSGTTANTWGLHNNKGRLILSKGGTSATPCLTNVNGNWGIDTYTPAYKFDINGIIRAEKLIGTATGITETSVEDEEFTYQATPINGIADGYRVDKIKGNTIAWNQQVINGDFSNGTANWYANQGTATVASNELTYICSAGTRARVQFTSAPGVGQSGHVYYMRFDYKSTINFNFQWLFGPGQNLPSASSWSKFTKIGQANSSSGYYSTAYFYNYASLSEGAWTLNLRNVNVFDLTLIFGAGKEPSTAEEFESMFPEAYYDYTAVELINNSAEAIETEAADSSWTSRLALGLESIKVKDSSGDILEIKGLASAGNVYDEIVGRTLISPIYRCSLEKLIWSTAVIGGHIRFQAALPETAVRSGWTLANSINSCGWANNGGPITDNAVDKSIGIYTNNWIYIRDDRYSTAAEFIAAMEGQWLYYELATPVTYDLVSSVPLSGRIDGNGTMRVISDGPVAPFRGDITYGCNPGQMGADASSVKSYLDTMLEIKVVDGVPMLHTTLPFYSDSFVSAGGLSGTGGSGSGSSLRDLSDVQLPEIITTGSALVYNGEKWVQSGAAFVPQTRTVNGLELSSDISLSLGDLSNVNTAGASNGLSLMYNDGEWTPGRAARVFYGTCSTGASATNKIVNCEGFTTADLVAGTIVIVYFTNASDKKWGKATLQVGATNAVNIWNADGWLTWDAGETVPFYYCPRGWQIGTTKGYTAAHGYNLPVADADTFGAVRIAYTHGSSESISINSPSTTAGRYYYVESNGLGRLFVNVPWTGGGSGGGGSYSAGTGISITNNTISVIKATTANLGGVLPAAVRSSTPTLITGETESNRYYGVEMNSSGQLFVNVPWTGGSGSASWGTTSKNTSPLTVGGTTKTVMLAGAATARNASPIINTGGTTANRYYGVEISNDGKLFVNVPWLEGGGSTGAYLPIAGGTMEGTINSQSVIAKNNNAYDLGSSGKYYANTYTKKIYLDDGVYIYYDSTNRVIRVQGAGIAATGSVNAGGVSNT